MMASNKSTQYWLVALKVLLLVLALGYIVVQLHGESALVIQHFKHTFQNNALGFFVVFFGWATLNWLLEVLKWRTTVRAWFPLSYKQAAQQCLGSLTASLITPNRIGEYGAKALYYNPKNRKKIIFLNFVHSSSQMLTTLLFGLPAFFYFIWNQPVTIATNKILGLLTGIAVVGIIAYLYRKKQLVFKGLTLTVIWGKFKQISTLRKVTIVTISIARYLVFSFLFYQILLFFGASLAPVEAMVCIYSMYLLVSIVPSFLVMDVVIKGGVAVWLFSFFGVSEIVVLATVFTMWILNTVLPAIVGSYFVLTFKLKEE